MLVRLFKQLHIQVEELLLKLYNGTSYILQLPQNADPLLKQPNGHRQQYHSKHAMLIQCANDVGILTSHC